MRLLHRAIETDPGYTLAKSTLAWLHVYRDSQRWSGAGDREAAVILARDAFAAHSDDPRTLSNVGHTFSHYAYDLDQAQGAADRALQLNPNSAHVLHRAGWVYLHRCEADPAIGFFARAMQLNPLDPEIGFILGGSAAAHLMAHRDEEALALASRGIKEMPTWVSNYRFTIWALVRLGRIDKARDMVQRFAQVSGHDRLALLRRHRSYSQAFNDEYVEVLRLVGVAS